jgi:hypothetical protein
VDEEKVEERGRQRGKEGDSGAKVRENDTMGV